MRKNSLTFRFAVLFLLPVCLYAQQAGVLKPSAVGIDAVISNIELKILPTEDPSISYSAELKQGTKVSFIEHNNRLRIRSVYPAEGTVTINVPKEMLLESCRVYATGGSLKIENIKAAFFVASMCEGSVSVKDCTLKTSSFTVAAGTLDIEAKLIAASTICVSETASNITIEDELNLYAVEYAQSIGSTINIGGKLYSGYQGFAGNSKAKRRIMLSAGNSAINIKHKPKDAGKEKS